MQKQLIALQLMCMQARGRKFYRKTYFELRACGYIK